ncbi:hypothetical protein AeNC1_012580, partial [Aphanomyces euteiches]
MLQEVVMLYNQHAMMLLGHDHVTALDVLKKALRLANSDKFTNTESLQILTYNNLGCCYRRLNKVKHALKYLHAAADIGAVTTHIKNLSITFLNLCAIESQMGHHTVALKHAQSAIFHAQEELVVGQVEDDTDYGDILDAKTKEEKIIALAIAYHNMAVELEHNNCGESSLQWYKKALQLMFNYKQSNAELWQTFKSTFEAAKYKYQRNQPRQSEPKEPKFSFANSRIAQSTTARTKTQPQNSLKAAQDLYRKPTKPHSKSTRPTSARPTRTRHSKPLVQHEQTKTNKEATTDAMSLSEDDDVISPTIHLTSPPSAHSEVRPIRTTHRTLEIAPAFAQTRPRSAKPSRLRAVVQASRSPIDDDDNEVVEVFDDEDVVEVFDLPASIKCTDLSQASNDQMSSPQIRFVPERVSHLAYLKRLKNSLTSDSTCHGSNIVSEISRQHKQALELDRIRWTAAVRLQSFFRGCSIRLRYDDKNNRLVRKLEAANQIQTRLRGGEKIRKPCLLKQRFQDEMHIVRQVAVTRLQAAVRMWRIRKKMSKYNEKARNYNNSPRALWEDVKIQEKCPNIGNVTTEAQRQPKETACHEQICEETNLGRLEVTLEEPVVNDVIPKPKSSTKFAGDADEIEQLRKRLAAKEAEIERLETEKRIAQDKADWLLAKENQTHEATASLGQFFVDTIHEIPRNEPQQLDSTMNDNSGTKKEEYLCGSAEQTKDPLESNYIREDSGVSVQTISNDSSRADGQPEIFVLKTSEGENKPTETQPNIQEIGSGTRAPLALITSPLNDILSQTKSDSRNLENDDNSRLNGQGVVAHEEDAMLQEIGEYDQENTSTKCIGESLPSAHISDEKQDIATHISSETQENSGGPPVHLSNEIQSGIPSSSLFPDDFEAKLLVERTFEIRQLAAGVIQGMYRGAAVRTNALEQLARKLSRQYITKLHLTVEMEHALAQEDRYCNAVMIQSCARGYLRRRRFKNAQNLESCDTLSSKCSQSSFEIENDNVAQTGEQMNNEIEVPSTDQHINDVAPENSSTNLCDPTIDYSIASIAATSIQRVVRGHQCRYFVLAVRAGRDGAVRRIQRCVLRHQMHCRAKMSREALRLNEEEEIKRNLHNAAVKNMAANVIQDALRKAAWHQAARAEIKTAQRLAQACTSHIYDAIWMNAFTEVDMANRLSVGDGDIIFATMEAMIQEEKSAAIRLTDGLMCLIHIRAVENQNELRMAELLAQSSWDYLQILHKNREADKFKHSVKELIADTDNAGSKLPLDKPLVHSLSHLANTNPDQVARTDGISSVPGSLHSASLSRENSKTDVEPEPLVDTEITQDEANGSIPQLSKQDSNRSTSSKRSSSQNYADDNFDDDIDAPRTELDSTVLPLNESVDGCKTDDYPNSDIVFTQKRAISNEIEQGQFEMASVISDTPRNGSNDQQSFALDRHIVEHLAATCIQAVLKGYRTRYHYNALKEYLGQVDQERSQVADLEVEPTRQENQISESNSGVTPTSSAKSDSTYATAVHEIAATCIQAVLKGYLVRKQYSPRVQLDTNAISTVVKYPRPTSTKQANEQEELTSLKEVINPTLQHDDSSASMQSLPQEETRLGETNAKSDSYLSGQYSQSSFVSEANTSVDSNKSHTSLNHESKELLHYDACQASFYSENQDNVEPIDDMSDDSALPKKAQAVLASTPAVLANFSVFITNKPTTTPTHTIDPYELLSLGLTFESLAESFKAASNEESITTACERLRVMVHVDSSLKTATSAGQIAAVIDAKMQDPTLWTTSINERCMWLLHEMLS